MAQIFPKWTNVIPLIVWVATLPCAALAVTLVYYYGSPKFTDVGYRPVQPVPYSHKLHAGDLGIDCRYCHAQVEVSPVATIPPTKVCMNCHSVLPKTLAMAPVRESMATGTPIQWVRIHNVPDFAYFDHSVHVGAGVGCASCHGNIHQMDVVQQAMPLSMAWCLACHRNPDMHLRPLSEVTNMDWTPPKDQLAFAKQALAERNINPASLRAGDCSACHR